MKKIIVFVLLFVAVNVLAQNVSVTDTVLKFGITEKGKPAGQKNEIKIGKEGGTIQSSDGKVELIFPAGAVSKKTNISIQPVTNYAPNSSGKAYQMEPSGINFQQPVKITIHYRDSDTEGGLPDLLGIAMQNDKGLWSSLEKVSIDTVSKTLSASISHFSFYVNFLKVKINPSSARVKVNGSLRLQLTYVHEVTEEDELAPLGTEINNPPLWSANGISGGDNIVGLVSASQNFSAIYKAPALVPDQNPVAVAVELRGSSTGISGRQFNILKLVSKIIVYGDAWEVNMTANLKGGSPAAWGGYTANNDEGSFIVSLEKKNPAIIGIDNQLEDFISNCSKTILNPTTHTGILHVAGIKNIKVTPANPPGQPYPIVEIWFKPHPTELTRFQFTCPPPPGYLPGNATGTMDLSNIGMLMMYGQPAIPTYLKFVAKDGEQVLIEKGKIGSELYYKIWVTKIR